MVLPISSAPQILRRNCLTRSQTLEIARGRNRRERTVELFTRMETHEGKLVVLPGVRVIRRQGAQTSGILLKHGSVLPLLRKRVESQGQAVTGPQIIKVKSSCNESNVGPVVYATSNRAGSDEIAICCECPYISRNPERTPKVRISSGQLMRVLVAAQIAEGNVFVLRSYREQIDGATHGLIAKNGGICAGHQFHTIDK